MTEHKNTILAIILSLIVVIGWEYYFARPELQNQAQQQQQQTQEQKPPQAQPNNPSGAQPAAPNGATPGAPNVPSGQAQTQTRAAVLANLPHVDIDTKTLHGSIDLKGARIDNLSLVQYRETTDANSPPIVLLSPSGAPDAFYAEFGWVPAAGSNQPMPGPDTVWKQEGSGALGVDRPVTLFPYGLVSRHGTPEVQGYYILHEGLIGVMGDHGLQEETYKKMLEKKSQSWDATNAWLGFTDKYWATVLLPDTSAEVKARFSASEVGGQPTYQTDYLADALTIAPGASGSTETRLFAGAKEVSLVGINFPLGPGGYNQSLQLNHFDLLIDWGWFYFITKPMFLALDFFFRLVGNFGIAILIVTVLVKALFFPLANKSYASMAKMKAVQPEMAMIKQRYADDRAKQQQAMMELYRKEQINPVAGCLPIAIQIPVFFSLYKVLFVTIEMRHAPFYGWIHDLSAADPTNIFTLGGLIPFDPTLLPAIGSFLHLGFWPAIMGVTMWVQMKLNPAPPDPAQQVIFNWMPLIFTFMLAHFPAGLVIYWAWNNSLSVVQQSTIMHRHGAKIELWDNLKRTFVKPKPKAPAE